MKLTRKKAIELFRKHWKWLAETGSEWKDGWPGWDFEKDLVNNCCFLCEYTSGDCDKCPIDWGVDHDKYANIYCEAWDDNHRALGLYGKWDTAKTIKTRKKYAKIISELPELEQKWKQE